MRKFLLSPAATRPIGWLIQPMYVPFTVGSPVSSSSRKRKSNPCLRSLGGFERRRLCTSSSSDLAAAAEAGGGGDFAGIGMWGNPLY